MKLPTSNKTSSFGLRPYIKKGYYPAKLLKVEPYSDKDGNLVEGTYGHQLIFEFAIYAKDENDTPTVPMMFEEEGKDAVPVKISKFVYHEYKDKENPGQFQTAITPNSKITALLKALGWEFSENDVDIEPLIGNWVEVNINDFTAKSKEGKQYTASSIADVEEYEGGVIPKNIEEVSASKKPEAVKKQIKHNETEKEMPKEEDMKKSPVDEENPEKLKEKIEELKKLNEQGFLTDDGLKQATEQLQAKLDSLTK